MKTIQVMFDEQLLADLDQTDKVRKLERSAVLRRIANELVRRRRAQEIDRQYERA